MTRTLRDVVETTDYPFTWTSTVAARSRTLAHARRRAAALVAAAVAVVVVGGSALVLLDHDRTTVRSTPAVARSLLDIPQGKAPQVSFLEGDAGSCRRCFPT